MRAERDNDIAAAAAHSLGLLHVVLVVNMEISVQCSRFRYTVYTQYACRQSSFVFRLPTFYLCHFSGIFTTIFDYIIVWCGTKFTSLDCNPKMTYANQPDKQIAVTVSRTSRGIYDACNRGLSKRIKWVLSLVMDDALSPAVYFLV